MHVMEIRMFCWILSQLRFYEVSHCTPDHPDLCAEILSADSLQVSLFWIEFLVLTMFFYLLTLAELLMDQSTQKPAAGDNAVTVSFDGQTNGIDVHVDEPTFSVGKSPLQVGHIADEQASGAGGLGQGTPKVCSQEIEI